MPSINKQKNLGTFCSRLNQGRILTTRNLKVKERFDNFPVAVLSPYDGTSAIPLKLMMISQQYQRESVPSEVNGFEIPVCNGTSRHSVFIRYDMPVFASAATASMPSPPSRVAQKPMISPTNAPSSVNQNGEANRLSAPNINAAATSSSL